MSASMDSPSRRLQADRSENGRAVGHDAMIRFSISPTASGNWAWRAYDSQGRLRAQGLAGTRKLAAAMVIHHIVSAHAERAAPASPEPRAKAA